MFSDLKNKVAKEIERRQPSECSSLRSAQAHRTRRDSSESLVSEDSVRKNPSRKDEHIKRLEAKITEFTAMLRQKSAAMESHSKEMEKIKSELARVRLEADEAADRLAAEHSTKLRLSTEVGSVEAKDGVALTQKLIKAEEELASVSRLSDDMLSQNNDLRLKAMQELTTANNKLAVMEAELKFLRSELEGSTRKLECSHTDIVQLAKEVETKTEALENAKDFRVKMNEEQTALENSSKQLQVEKDGFQKQVQELLASLSEKASAVSRQEQRTVEEADRASVALAESEKLRTKLASAQARSEDRESDLKDRIRMLEERIVVLTEPGSQFIEQRLADVSATLPTTAAEVTGPLQLITPSEPVAVECTNCNALTTERRLLESRLEDMRSHLAEVKTTWNDQLLGLESQISHLNTKIAEDNEEHKQATEAWSAARSDYETQQTQLREELAVAQRRVSSLESHAAEITRVQSQKGSDWDEQRHLLQARVSALELQTNEESNKYAESTRINQELQSQLTASSLKLQESLETCQQQEQALIRTKQSSEAHQQEVTTLRTEVDTSKETVLQSKMEVTELKKKIQTDVAAIDNLKQELATTAEALANAQRACSDEQANHQAEAEKLNDAHLQFQTTIDGLTADLGSKTAEADQRNEHMLKLEDEVQQLKKERDSLKETGDAVQLESLKEQVDSLHETVSDRNKTIRLQRQKIQELRKALGQGARDTQAVPLNSTMLVEEESASKSGLTASGSISSLTTDTGIYLGGSFSSSTAHSGDDSRRGKPYLSSSIRHNDNGHPATHYFKEPGLLDDSSPMDPVNFHYLRHVILKFVLSRESEAIHLIRALSTLLHFSHEDESLLRETLESRRSWFSTRPSAVSGGQFAKMIPPPN